MELFTGGWDPFIPVYPGSKSWGRYRKAILGGSPFWGAVVEPFCGTGSTALYACTEHRYLGESEPDVRAIWYCWRIGQWRDVQKLVGAAQGTVLEKGAQEAWDWAKSQYEADRCDPVSLAAASLVLRKLAFGGVIRRNRSGRVNVTWNQDKIASFLNWECRAPEPPTTGIISISNSWECCIEAWLSDGPANSLILIDPPYAVGSGPAYGGHNPNDTETLALALDPLRAVVDNPKATRIVVCNYWSEFLDRGIRTMAGSRIVTGIPMGAMTTMNRRGTAATMQNEYFWVLV
ncbi:MAG: hypothetical protein ACO4AI_16585 [Prochlorothrix sp.]